MTLESGRSVGPYTIKKKIGKGGMGEVYTAFQHSTGRTVALKMLNTRLNPDDDSYQRFQREVAIIAQLEHPHILPVYDFGEVDGSPYVVMRYMRGGAFADHLDTLSLKERMDILTQIGGALDAAHNWQIIHRDLKPGNILLDEAGHGYLADFGLAKTMSGSKSLTATGGIVGTPAYMSPEQARGDELDASADIYALGIMVYQLICGEHPFQANSPIDYLSKHLIEAAPSIRDKLPFLPITIDKLLLAAMAKEKEARPRKASHLIVPIQKTIAELPASELATINATALNVSAPTPHPKTILAQTRAAAPSAPPKQAKSYNGIIWRAALALFALLGIGWGVANLPAFDAINDSRLATYSVGDSPRAAVALNDAIWVVNGFDNSVSRLTRSDCAAAENECPRQISGYATLELPSDLLAENGHLWLASSLDQSMAKIDPTTGEIIEKSPLPFPPSHLAADGAALWSLHSYSNAVTQIDLESGAQKTIDVGDFPAGIIAAEGALYISHLTGAEIWRLDRKTGDILKKYPLPSGGGAMAWHQNSLWAALPEANLVASIDPDSGELLRQTDVQGSPVALLAEGGWLWVAIEENNSVIAIGAEGEIVQTHSLPDPPSALAWESCGENCANLWIVSNRADSITRLPIMP